MQKLNQKLRLAGIILCSLILTNCSSQKIEIEEQPCPLPPELIVIDEEMANTVAPHIQAIVAENYIRLIEYAARLEVRARCEVQ